jgi:hypothetical protein
VKFFTLIFSFYLLALAIMPCSDKDDCKYMSADQTISATTDHSDHGSDTEHCPPFCMCACCGQTCHFTHYQADLGFDFPTISQKNAVYQPSFVSEVYLSIWQPPKIS